MIRLKTIHVFFYFFLSAKLFCAEIPKLHFSQICTQDGLSQNTVRTLLNDRKGFIWAGTLDGLNRYDGYRMKVQKPRLGAQNTLKDHRIKNVFQDRDGYLWIKTYSGEFCCYDPTYESYIDYLPDSLADKHLSYTEFHEASNGDIWLWGDNYGCAQIRKLNGSFRSSFYLMKENALGGEKAYFLYEDTQSTIWIGTNNEGLIRIREEAVDSLFFDKGYFRGVEEVGNKLYFLTEAGTIWEYNLKRNDVQSFSYGRTDLNFRYIIKGGKNELLLSTLNEGILCFNVNSKLFEKPRWAESLQLTGTVDFIVDKDKGVWMYNYTGVIWYYNPETGLCRKMTLIPPDIIQTIDMERYSIFIDSDNLVWITTYGNGLFCYDREKGSLSNYRYNASQNSPASNYLLSITEDNYGNIWIGSEYAGLIKVTKARSNIQVIRPEPENAIGKNNNVRTLYRDINGDIWVGTKNGNLYLYNSSLTKEKKVFKNITPYSIVEDSDKNIWVGTKGQGAYIIDRTTMNIKHQFIEGNKSSQLSHSSVFCLLKDKKDRIWIGTYGKGINLAEKTSEGFVIRRFFEDDYSNRRYIRYLYQDSKGMIWACSGDGIIQFDPDKLIQDSKAYSLYRMDMNDTESLNGNDVKTIFEDSNQRIWIGTAGGGLNKYIPETAEKKEHFIHYTSEDGLAGDIVTGIMEDQKRILWISTENGITKFEPKSTSFLVYHFSENTYGNHFNENANIFTPDGIMLWGSLDGILAFSPDSYIPDLHHPPVTLTNFFIYNQPVEVGENAPLKESISYAKEITLSYKQNTFTIEFTSQDLTEPDKNKYTYTLENYDKQWSIVNRSNAATYKNLPPGKYIFHVKGANKDGVWNEESTDIEITIVPPFWKTGYAYLLYALLVALVLYMILQVIVRFNTLNNKIKVEKELTNFKLRFFTNISHEFRTPLTIIRGAVENLNEISGVSPDMKRQISLLGRNSNILTRLIDQLLEFRKLQNNVLTLDLEETDIVNFSKEIYIELQELARQKNINYLFTPNTSSYEMFIDRRKVDKILYNLLSNAFKFTPTDGVIELAITVDTTQQICRFSVKDNGIGIEKDKQHLLFSRFMQIHFSSAGTGVGLSLVKEFVDVHKGKIWYENNDGGGSIFHVELSTCPETYKGENFISSIPSDIIHSSEESKIFYPSDTTDEVRIPEIEDSILSNYKMLIIDDNNDILTFLIEEFSKYFMVDIADNGETGLNKAREINPDLIICDVMMPQKDGFEVTRSLKEDFQTCHIPVILLTAHSSAAHQLEGIQSGADAYIMKPFSLKYLVARVFKLIEQREQLKKRFSNEYVLDGSLITTTDKDKNFYNLINSILEEHLTDPQFSVERFAELAKQRRTIFYKKVKGITGLSPNELIKIRRMKRAAELLSQNEFTVAEVAYKVGFEDPFYFSKCFKTLYNCSPSKFGQKPKEEQ